MAYANPEKRRQFQREYAEKNPEKVRKWRESFQGSKSDSYWLWTRAKARAVKNNIDFTITVDDIAIPEFCPIFPDIKLERSKGKCTYSSMSLDRRNNAKGYVPGNIQVISNKGNVRKSDMSVEEVRQLLKYMEETLNGS